MIDDANRLTCIVFVTRDSEQAFDHFLFPVKGVSVEGRRQPSQDAHSLFCQIVVGDDYRRNV